MSLSESSGEPKKVEETLDLILQEIKSLSERVGTLESASQPSSHPTPQYPTWGDAGIGADQCHRRDTTAESFHCAVGSHSAPTATVDAEFQRLRNTVQSVRLPPNLTLQESRQGVKREDLPLFNVLAKCARYTETTMKLCARVEGDSHEDVFNCMYAMIKYIQDEYAALIVNSTFDPNVSRVFRSLQRNTGFTAETMEHLRSATTIASAYRPQPPARARGRGGGRHGFQFRDQFSQARGFPKRGGANNASAQPSQNTDN